MSLPDDAASASTSNEANVTANGAPRKQVQIVGAPPPHFGSGRKEDQNGVESDGEDADKDEDEDGEDDKVISEGEEIDDANLLDAFPDDSEVRVACTRWKRQMVYADLDVDSAAGGGSNPFETHPSIVAQDELESPEEAAKTKLTSERDCKIHRH